MQLGLISHHILFEIIHLQQYSRFASTSQITVSLNFGQARTGSDVNLCFNLGMQNRIDRNCTLSQVI